MSVEEVLTNASLPTADSQCDGSTNHSDAREAHAGREAELKAICMPEVPVDFNDAYPCGQGADNVRNVNVPVLDGEHYDYFVGKDKCDNEIDEDELLRFIEENMDENGEQLNRRETKTKKSKKKRARSSEQGENATGEKKERSRKNKQILTAADVEKNRKKEERKVNKKIQKELEERKQGFLGGAVFATSELCFAFSRRGCRGGGRPFEQPRRLKK